MKFILDGTARDVMQPMRYQILQTLMDSDKPLYVEQIAQSTKIHPRLVSHHLDVLQDLNLVTSKYENRKLESSKREVAVRMCSSTPHAKDVLRDIKESLS